MKVTCEKGKNESEGKRKGKRGKLYKKKGLSCLKIASLWVNLRFDGVLKTPSFVGGGGVESTPPPFLFVKIIEKVIR